MAFQILKNSATPEGRNAHWDAFFYFEILLSSCRIGKARFERRRSCFNLLNGYGLSKQRKNYFVDIKTPKLYSWPCFQRWLLLLTCIIYISSLKIFSILPSFQQPFEKMRCLVFAHGSHDLVLAKLLKTNFTISPSFCLISVYYRKLKIKSKNVIKKTWKINFNLKCKQKNIW